MQKTPGDSREDPGAAITDGGGLPPLSALVETATTGDSRPEVDYTPRSSYHLE